MSPTPPRTKVIHKMQESEENENEEIKEEPPPAPAVTPLPYKKVFIGAMVSFFISFIH